MTDGDNTWGNGAVTDPATAAADVAYATAKTYDFYDKTFGRRGIFDNGRGVPSYVHVGNQMANAYWLGNGVNIMVYGDGPRESAPFTEMDIAAHEMTHGVTENSVPGGLVYAGESGGLNEATSDIFGTMVEFYAANPNDPGDYDIGEQVDLFGNGTPFRRMYNQASDGASLSCWSPQAPDFDPHQWSGVGNHFFFDLAEGTGRTKYGTSPICGNAPAVTGIGRDKAAQIWYRALTTYFTSTTDHHQARGYTLSAAADLYGRCGTEYRTVQRAWTAVGVTGQDGC
jgi:Zn-dependent metalloprotease